MQVGEKVAIALSAAPPKLSPAEIEDSRSSGRGAPGGDVYCYRMAFSLYPSFDSPSNMAKIDMMCIAIFSY
jgi:hypothetical protein